MILITGASGFLGRGVVSRLVHESLSVRAAVRDSSKAPLPAAVEVTPIQDIGPQTVWQKALQEVHTIVHCAARVHILKEHTQDPLASFRSVNTEGTRTLAEQAAQCGVKRFIFISSMAVHGLSTPPHRPFKEMDPPSPHDTYGISKWEAEQALHEIAQKTGLEVVIIRPPLVYGPHAPGNFQRMVNAVKSGVPLPLGSVHHNRRTLVGLDNLIDLIFTSIHHPKASGQIFLAGDEEDVSTTDLLTKLYQAMGQKPRLIPVPVRILTLGAALLGKTKIAQQLLGSLQADTQKARNLLGWKPILSLDEGLKRAVAPLLS